MSTRSNPLQDVLEPVLEGLGATAVCSVPIESARGLMLAEPLRSIAPVPPHAIALRSGLAVVSLDVAGASAHAPIMLARRPIAITAGDSLPEDCDAVIDSDALTEAGPLVLITDTAAPALNARLAGQDLEVDTVILPAGRRITPEAILACRLAGIREASVRRPAFSIEIEDAAHSAWLAGRLTVLGCALVDDRRASDLVIRETRRTMPRLALLPGDTSGIEMLSGGVPMIEVPWRFDGVLASCLALIFPVVARLLRQSMRTVELPLVRNVASAIGMTEVLLLRQTAGTWEPLAVGDITLPALAQADAYCLIPDGAEGYAAGEQLAAIRLDDPFGPVRHEY